MSSKMQLVRQKLGQCQNDLTRWSVRKFGNAEKILKQKTKELETLQMEEGPENWDAIKLLQSEIDLILEHENIRWK